MGSTAASAVQKVLCECNVQGTGVAEKSVSDDAARDDFNFAAVLNRVYSAKPDGWLGHKKDTITLLWTHPLPVAPSTLHPRHPSSSKF